MFINQDPSPILARSTARCVLLVPTHRTDRVSVNPAQKETTAQTLVCSLRNVLSASIRRLDRQIALLALLESMLNLTLHLLAMFVRLMNFLLQTVQDASRANPEQKRRLILSNARLARLVITLKARKS